ncbi:MAG: hypothetical protein KDM91_02385 [Verrucomicrobiae bacterium]|nr:hypothetical protein [Verrucomicrobiae bacterium]
MAEQLPALILLAPLFGALLVGLAGPRDRRVCFPVVLGALAVSLCSAVGVLVRVLAGGPVDYFVGGWSEPLGIGIQLRVDTLNGLVLVVIAVVFVLVGVFSIRRAGEENTEKSPQYYTLFLLLAVGVFGMTVTGDAFNLYVLVEVSSLTGYALIAMGSSPRGTVAAFNYVVMGTIGASFYLLGVGYLYMATGALNMAQIHEIVATTGAGGSRTVLVAFILILAGLWTKMAFFPLHGWLPNAYGYCPSTSSSVLAPLVTKVYIYVMIRVMLGVFGAEWIFEHVGWTNIVVWLATVAILAGSLLALAQTEVRKMLCYLIVAEVGYMVGGAWLANRWGMAGAVYHIVADALMTLCLFLAVNIIVKRTGRLRMDAFDGLFRKMPLTMAGFAVGALAMIGIPPTAGFFSKWYLVRGGIESGHFEYVAALLLSSLVNAVLFFRLFERAFFGGNPAGGHHPDRTAAESGPTQQGWVGDSTLLGGEARASTLGPLLAAAALVVAVGLLNGPIVSAILRYFENMPVLGAP